ARSPRTAAVGDPRVGRLDPRGRRRRRTPDLPPAAAAQRVRRRRGAPVPDRGAGALRRTGAGAAAVRRPTYPGGGAVSDLTRRTAAELADALAAGEASSVEITQ